MLTIGLDAKRAFYNSTGLGNYCRGLISGLIEQQTYALNLYTPGVSNLFYQTFKESLVTIKQPITNFHKQFTAYWRSIDLTKRLINNNIDLYHGLSNELPLTIQKASFPKVVTIHDVIFITNPKFYPAIDRLIYQFKTKKACLHADRIIVPSTQTKQELIRHFNAQPNKIEVIPMCVNPVFQKTYTADALEAIKQRYQLPNKYILHVGTLSKRKNQLKLVEWLSQLKNKNVSLVLVGKGNQNYVNELTALIEYLNLYNRVFVLSKLVTQDLPAIYRLASLFVYPSKIEGFGIPIAEAMMSEIPVIASKGTCFEEVGGEGIDYFNLNHDAEVIDLIDNKLNQVSKERIKQNFIRANDLYTQQAMTKKTVEVYKQLL